MSNKHSTEWFNNKSAQNKTIEVLEQLAQRYKHLPHLWGIELLNEPAVDFFGFKLARFYRRTYRAVTKVARPGTRIVFSDGYAPLRLSNCFWLMTKREFPVVLDCHIYQVFGRRNKAKSFDQHIGQLKLTRLFLRFLRLQQPVIVGEWSAMLPIPATPEMTTKYISAQQAAFDGTLAHFYWNYKTEPEGRWNYRDQVEKGLLQ